MAWLVNGEPVDEALVREQMAIMRPRYEEEVTDMDPIEAEMQLKEWARENVIERMLLRQEALADPEPVPADFPEGGDLEQFKMARLFERMEAGLPPLRPKEISDFYKQNRAQFRSQERVYAKHILKRCEPQEDDSVARAALEQAQVALANGETFEDVADRISDCGGNGGDLGWFARGEMVEEFDAIAFSIPVGSVSAIFRTGFGLHIAKVYDRKPEGVAEFDEVKGHIERMFLEQRRERFMAEYLDQLRAKAVVKRA